MLSGYGAVPQAPYGSLFYVDPVLLLAIVLLLASFVQGILGFGFGMLTMSFAATVFPMQEAVPLVTGYALLVNAYLMYRLREYIRTQGLWPILAGGLVGVPVGVALLKHVNEGALLVALGVVMICHVGWSFRLSDPSKLNPGRPWAVFAGLCSGAFGASLGTAGPPVVMYGSTKPWDKNQLRGTLQAFFFISCAVQVVLYGGAGLLTAKIIQLNVVLAPLVAVGGMLGLRFSKRLPQAAFRKLVLVGLFCLSVTFLRRGLLDLGVF